jgi:pimeloyl-ACP methyl ester carboxylesterase
MSEHTFNYHDYDPAAVQPFAFANDAVKDTIYREAVDQRIGYALSGQQFSAIHVNREQTGNPVIVRINSLWGNTGNTDQQYIAAQYAAAFPEHSYVSIDLPGHGASSSLTKAQRKAINASGDVRPVGDAHIEAVMDLVPDMSEVITVGEGVGEVLMLAFAARAARHGIAVRNLFGIDPMGLEDRSPLALTLQYHAVAEKSRAERAKESDAAANNALEAAFSTTFTQEIAAYDKPSHGTRPKYAGIMARERAVGRFMFRKSPLTHSTGMELLEEAIWTQPSAEARLLFAGRSVVGRLNPKVEYELTSIGAASRGRVHYDVLPNDNQDIGLARNQPRLIKYIKDNL